MTATPRAFASFNAAFALSFKEEFAGETFFAALAETEPDPRQAALGAKLALIKTRTVAAPRPLATAMDLTPVDKAAVRRQGRDETADGQALPFAEGMAIGVRDYPTGYEQEFRVVRPIALPQAKCAVQLLIDHEVAITDMARAELARAFGPAAPLDTYLAQVAGGTAGGAHDR